MFTVKKNSRSRSKPVVADVQKQLQGGLKNLRQYVQGQKEGRPADRFSSTPFGRMKADRNTKQPALQNLKNMLEQNGFDEYFKVFYENGITTISQLQALSQSDIEKYVPKPGHRIKLQKLTRPSPQKSSTIDSPVKNKFDGVFDQQRNKAQFQRAVAQFRRKPEPSVQIQLQTQQVKAERISKQICCYQCLRTSPTSIDLKGKQFCSPICVDKFRTRNLVTCTSCHTEQLKLKCVSIGDAKMVCEQCRTDYEGLLLQLN